MPARPLAPVLLIPALVCLLAHCDKPAPSAAEESEPPLAVVGGEPITAGDLRAEAAWRRDQRQTVPPADELLDEMVRRLALVQRARSEGLESDPEIRRRCQSILIAGLRARELDRRVAEVKIGDDEVLAAYEAGSGAFEREALDRFAILFLEADAKMSASRRAELRERLEAGLARADARPAKGGRGPAATGFGAVAIDHSDDQASRYRGGDIGWIGADAGSTRWPDSVIETGRALAKGERSGVLETDQGFYAIMKTDARAGGRRPLEEVAPELRRRLLREKRRQLEKAFVEESLAAAAVELDRAAVEAIELDEPASAEAPTPPSAPGLPATAGGAG
mgnify:CR=1 FL=1